MPNSTKRLLRLSSATGIRRFGEHLTWTQEPDIFHMRLAGTLEVDQFKKILDWQANWSQNKPRYYVICDMSQLQSISRDTRKMTSEQAHVTPAHALTINYGASFALRVMAEMSTRARKVMGLPDLADVVFVDTQEEALAELEKRRNAEKNGQSSR